MPKPYFHNVNKQLKQLRTEMIKQICAIPTGLWMWNVTSFAIEMDALRATWSIHRLVGSFLRGVEALKC